MPSFFLAIGLEETRMVHGAKVSRLQVILAFPARQQVVTYVPGTSDVLPGGLKKFVLGLVVFIGKGIFPVQLSIAPTPRNSSMLPDLISLAVILLLYFKIGVHSKRIALGGLFIFLVLIIFPVWFGAINPIGEQYEHRIYTPMIGLFIFLSQLKINFQNKGPQRLLAFVILVLATRTFYRMPIYENMLTYMDEGIKDCPENFLFHMQKANLLFARRHYEECIPYYSESIKLRPARFESYHNRGSAYVLLNRKAEALADLDKALELSKYQPSIWVSRCTAYLRFGEYEKAMSDLRELQKCCNADIPPGLVSEVSKRWAEERLTRLDKQILENPNKAMLYVDRAKLCFILNAPVRVLNDLRKAVELEPRNTEYRDYLHEMDSIFALR